MQKWGLTWTKKSPSLVGDHLTSQLATKVEASGASGRRKGDLLRLKPFHLLWVTI